jgi:hypothetical protein
MNQKDRLIAIVEDWEQVCANLNAEVKRLREVISRATDTLLSNPPEELFELTSPTPTQDIGDLIGFYTQAMGHAIGILEGTE